MESSDSIATIRSVTTRAETAGYLTGLITLSVKLAGKRSAGKLHATFDVAGAGNGVERPARQSPTLLKHFPCLKLGANQAYGLLAMVAHNLLRWVALVEKPDKPHFSKKLRRRFVFIPAKVIRHARQVIMKVPVQFFREVQRLRQAWRLPLHPAPAMGIGLAPS